MTPEQRSRCMAAVKSSDTKPEMLVRRYLHNMGLRYSLHNKKLPGSPDIVMRRFKTVIFVHGCFWHGHESCKYYRLPKSNTEFWQDKVNKNRARDERDIEALHKLGWNVIVVWECELKTETLRQQTFSRLADIFIRTYTCSDNPIAVAAEQKTQYGNNF